MFTHTLPTYNNYLTVRLSLKLSNVNPWYFCVRSKTSKSANIAFGTTTTTTTTTSKSANIAFETTTTITATTETIFVSYVMKKPD
jgi:hypothetical protein